MLRVKVDTQCIFDMGQLGVFTGFVCDKMQSFSSHLLYKGKYLSHILCSQSGKDADDEFTLMKTICTVCGQRRCPRHR